MEINETKKARISSFARDTGYSESALLSYYAYSCMKDSHIGISKCPTEDPADVALLLLFEDRTKRFKCVDMLFEVYCDCLLSWRRSS